MIRSVKTRVLEIASALTQRGLTLATAESCTGGGLSYWLTSVPGSSAWFERGFVTYSNAAKTEMLGVEPATIAAYGAVSAETAQAMAQGVLKNSTADLAVAITGIAGPAGGTDDKPVGTVWIAFSKRHATIRTSHEIFPGDRQSIRLSAIAKAMEMILEG